MKKIFYALFFCLNLVLLSSQLKAQDAFEPGFVILADGTRVGALIRLNSGEPWFNQRFIWTRDSAAAISNPNVKPKKYKVDDLSFYQVGQRKFSKQHYVDLENLQLKSMGTNNHMLEQLASGRINAYRFYAYPKDFDAFYGTEEEYKEKQRKDKSDLMRGYKFLIKKDNAEKFQDAFDTDLQKYFEDTPEVLNKYVAGEYGNDPVTVKKGLAAKMMAMARKTAFKPQIGDAYILAFADYNRLNAGRK